MADESVIYCPLCGNKVPFGVAKCPVCATELQQVKARRSAEKAALEYVADDFLHRELPKVALPETKHTCPLCALELTGMESKCPRCGVPLAPSEEEMLECPECGALAPSGTKSCPKCGVGFEEAPGTAGPTPIEELPPLPEPPKREPVPQRPMPEVVTTIPPRTAPSAGKGQVNGRGAVNGTGLVNGTGMINGTRGETRLGATRRQRLFITRWQFLAVLIALVIVIPTFIYLSYSQESTPFTVDGNFDEWAHAEKFGMYVQSGSSAISVNEWAIDAQDTRLFVYVSVEGTIMSSSEVSSFYLFVDSDNSPSTGYSVAGIGAEYLLQLDGWNGSVQSTAVSEYGATADKFDWNSWESFGSLSSSTSGNQLEAMADLPVTINSAARFMLMSQNSQEDRSVSYSVPAKGGLLVVHLEPGTGILSGLIAPSANVAMLRLSLSCEGTAGTVESITPNVVGATLVSSVQDVSLSPGGHVNFDVLVDASAASAGSLVSVSLSSSDISSTFADIQIIGEGTRAYVTSPPSAIVIDGAFADWAGKTTADTDAAPNANPNIDINAVGAVNDTTMSAFYVSVVGQMCSGSYVPIIKEKPSGGGGGIVVPTRKTGEDILRIYIDSDMNNATGFVMTLSSKVIGADHLLEVRGLDGNLVSRSIMVYLAGQWNYASGTIDAAKDDQRLEISVSAASLSGASSIDFIVETTDWRPRTDLATAVPQGTRAVPGGILAAGGIESWIVDGSTTSMSATAMSYQRKLFYDGTNYWSFFFDGTNTMYKYSTDFGQTWTLGGQAFSTAGINEASVWYDSATYTLYIIGDHASASTSVHVRKGTVASATHIITWSGNDVQVVTSSVILGGKNTYISRDSSGYIWLTSSNCTQAAPARYQLSVYRSTAVNSTAGWRNTGNMISGSGDPTPGLKGSIVNIGSGTTMLAVYGYSGNVSARTYTGSWSAETLIYFVDKDNPANTDNAPPSVVVDGRGVAHVVYGDGHQQPTISKPKIYYVYYNGAWSVPYRLDIMPNTQGNIYPTISLDSTTGNVFAFWIETHADGVGYSVIAKKNVSGTWTFWSLSSDTVYAKQYLTSIYSAANEQLICWQWTQNTTAPIQVHFDKIPEFDDIALPVFGMIASFVIVYRYGSARRKKPSDD